MTLNEYSADFESVVNEEKTRVWLWGIIGLDLTGFTYGTDIDTFIEHISKESCIIYFHNLKFDGTFLLYWLLHHDYRHTSARKEEIGEFSTLISDMGVFYTITVTFRTGKRVIFRDSLKKIPMSVAAMPKAFGLPIKKLEIDYNEVRDLDHVPTPEEIEYVKHDVMVVAMALQHMAEEGMKKITVASNALNNFKKRINSKKFDRLFPQLDLKCDADCRKSYKGGWSYLNDKYKLQDIGEGSVYDVNSMYPWAMSSCLLPYGLPQYYEGEYEYDEIFPLYIQALTCKFKLKPGKYPSIQLKGSIRFNSVEYLKDSNGEDAMLTLTSVDLELMRENYEMCDIVYHGGYKFRGRMDLFTDYIDYWYGVKKQTKSEGNMALYTIAKLMLNSLYGKFGSNPRRRSKYPYLDKEKDIVRYALMEEEIGTGGYVPVASFITSYCRDKIIRSANQCGDRFIYADTDSLHVLGHEPIDIDVDDYRLGAFKRESDFTKAKYLRAKCYIEEIEGYLDKKCAGLPESARGKFTFETMQEGMTFEGKLRPKNVPGGQVLVETPFTLKNF